MAHFALLLTHSAKRGWQKIVEGQHWLYVLPATPFLSDMVETGSTPSTLRGWITELVVGGLIVLLIRKIRRDYVAAVSLARMDALTGLGNRRAFDEAIESELARTRRSRQSLTLVYIDLDNFKQVNDRFGHAAGDTVLRDLSKAISHAARAKVDSAFRLGGDEFALLLPGSDAAEAQAVISRIRELATHAAGSTGGSSGSGFSAGIVEYKISESAVQFLHRADASMYAKKSSRQGIS